MAVNQIKKYEGLYKDLAISGTSLSKLFNGSLSFIPPQLLDSDRTHNWKEIQRPGETNTKKVPVDKHGSPKSHQDSSIYTPIDVCAKRMRENNWGLGISLGNDGLKIGNNYLWCFDYDGFVEKDGKQVDDELEKILSRLDTYTEISVSGTGCKAYFLSDKHPQKKSVIHFGPSDFVSKFPETKKYQGREVELFSMGYFLALTGDPYDQDRFNQLRFIPHAEVKTIITEMYSLVPEGIANDKPSSNEDTTKSDLGFEIPDFIRSQASNDDLIEAILSNKKDISYARLRTKSLSKVLNAIDPNCELVWSDVANALARVYGEEGREFFHEYSCRSKKYHETQCGDRYDRALRELEGRPDGYGTNRLVELSGLELAGLEWEESVIEGADILIKGERLAINANDITLIQGTLTHDKVALLAERTFANQFLFNHSTGKWMEYTGYVWREDDLGRVPETIRQLTRIANTQGKTVPQNANFIAGVEKLARNAPTFSTNASKFDADVYMLNTPGGVIDLRTNEIRPTTPEDRLSKITSVGPSAEGGKVFRQFLDEITLGDTELQQFHKVSLGACLSGARNGHWLLFWTGGGRNGKNTLGELVSDIFNSYASKIPSSVLMAKNFEGHPTEIAQLHGLRLATASEVEEGCFWHESRLNELTGDKVIKARVMRGDFFEFPLTHKHLIYGNHRPQIRNATIALKSRLKIVPFKASFVGREDTTLPDRLRQEAPYVLHWLLEGHKEWMINAKLPSCEAVEYESREYFESQSTIDVWVQERTVTADNLDDAASSWVSSTDLYIDFKSWKQRRGEGAPSNVRFSEMMKGKYPSKKSNGVRYGGIKLRVPVLSAFDFSLFPAD